MSQGFSNPLNFIWPVGAIFISTSADNPGNLLGGTWVRIAEGRTLIGEGTGAGLTARTAGAELGQEDAVVVTHDHTISHNHNISHTHNHAHNHNVNAGGNGAHNHPVQYELYDQTPNTESVIDNGTADGLFRSGNATSSGSNHNHNTLSTGNQAGNNTNSISTSNTGAQSGNVSGSEGESATDKNMQPSLVVYIWERTA